MAPKAEHIEDKIENKTFTFTGKDIKWIVAVILLVATNAFTLVTWVNKDKDYRAKVDTLETENKDLIIKVSTLEGKIEGVSSAAKIFMENPPAVLDGRISKNEVDIRAIQDKLAGPSQPTPTAFVLDTSTVLSRPIE